VSLPVQLLDCPTVSIIREPVTALLSGFAWARDKFGFGGTLEAYLETILERSDVDLPRAIQSRVLATMIDSASIRPQGASFPGRRPSWLMTLEDFRLNTRIAEAAQFGLDIPWKPIHYGPTISSRSTVPLEEKDQRFLSSRRVRVLIDEEIDVLFDLYRRAVTCDGSE
jgi:hypothetical protein